MNVAKGIFVLIGLVISYLAGILICYIAVATIFDAWNNFTSLENVLAWGLGILFVAPGFAFGYRRLLKRLKIIT